MLKDNELFDGGVYLNLNFRSCESFSCEGLILLETKFMGRATSIGED